MLCLVTYLYSTLCDPMDCSLPGSFVHRDYPGKYTGMGCHALLQGIFPTQGSNPGLLHYRRILHCLIQQGKDLYYIFYKAQQDHQELSMHPNAVHCSIIYNRQDMQTTEMSINRWTDNQDTVHTENGLLLSQEKQWNNAICSNVDGTGHYHTKRSESDRERQKPNDITCI